MLQNPQEGPQRLKYFPNITLSPEEEEEKRLAREAAQSRPRMLKYFPGIQLSEPVAEEPVSGQVPPDMSPVAPQPQLPPMAPESPFNIGGQDPFAPVPFEQTIGPPAPPIDPLQGMGWGDIKDAAAARAAQEQRDQQAMAALQAMIDQGFIEDPNAPEPEPVVEEPELSALEQALQPQVMPQDVTAVQPDAVPQMPVPQPIEAGPAMTEEEAQDSDLDRLREERREKVESRMLSNRLEAANQARIEGLKDYAAEMGPLERFAMERDAALANAPGIIASIFRATKDEDKLALAQEMAGMSSGLANKLGGTFGMMGPAVADIIIFKNVAGALAPAFADMGYARTAKALATAGSDVTDLWKAGQKMNAALSLMAEEIPFLTADIINGSDISTILANAALGISMGGGGEAVLAKTLGKVLGHGGPRIVELPDQPVSQVLRGVTGEPEQAVRAGSRGALEPRVEAGEAEPPVDRRVADMGPPEGQAERRSIADRARDVVAGGLERVSRAVETDRRASARTVDQLTGIQNNDAFVRARPAVDADPNRAWVAVDLRNSKAANELIGHDGADDRLFRRVGQLMRENFGDQVSFRKSTGDEFAVAVPAGQEEEAARILKEAFPDEQIVPDQPFMLGIDVGYGKTYGLADDMATANKHARTDPSWRGGALDETAQNVPVRAEPDEAEAATDAVVDRVGYDPEAPPDNLYGADPYDEPTRRDIGPGLEEDLRTPDEMFDRPQNRPVTDEDIDLDLGDSRAPEEPSGISRNMPESDLTVVREGLSAKEYQDQMSAVRRRQFELEQAGQIKSPEYAALRDADRELILRVSSEGQLQASISTITDSIRQGYGGDEGQLARLRGELKRREGIAARSKKPGKQGRATIVEGRNGLEIVGDDGLLGEVKWKGRDVDEVAKEARAVVRALEGSDRKADVAAAVRNGILDNMDGEQLRHSFGFQAIDDFLDTARHTGLGRMFARKFFVAGDVAKPVWDRYFSTSQQLKALMFRANERASRINHELAAKHGIDAVQASSIDGLPVEIKRDLEIAWSVGNNRAWDPTMSISQEMFHEMRQLGIDSKMISDKMVGAGLVGGQLAESMSDQAGFYLSRSYRKFGASGYTPTTQEEARLMNWAMDTYGFKQDEAEQFMLKLSASSDLNEAMAEVAKASRGWDRAQIRFGTSGQAVGATEQLSGYVPGNVRRQIEKLVSGPQVSKDIDDFIQRRNTKIIDDLSAKRDAVRADLDAMDAGTYTGKESRKALETKYSLTQNHIEELWSRREIPDELRAFFGEETNPVIRALDTLQKQGELWAGSAVARQIVKTGIAKRTVRTLDELQRAGLSPDEMRKNWTSLSKKDIQLGRVGPITTQGPGSGRPLLDPDHLYIRNDVLDALNDRFRDPINDHISTTRKLFMGVNEFVKGNLTVRNPGTHGRNFFGAKLFEVASGLARPTNFGSQIRRLADAFDVSQAASGHMFDPDAAPGLGRLRVVERAGRRTDEQLKLATKMIKLGLIDQSVIERGLADNLREMAKKGDYDSWVEAFRKKHLSGPIGSRVKTADDIAREVYRAEDDVARVVMYLGELEELEKANWGASTAARELEAARKANMTYPNYDMLPNIIQDLRRNPILSSFPSFAWEVMRTTKNNLVLAAEEWDAGMKGRSLRRLQGIVTSAVGVPFAATTIGGMLTGMTKNEIDALRRDQGEYQRYNTIVPVMKNEDGSVFYIDMGYTDPHGVIRSVFNAFADAYEREGFLGEAGKLRNAFAEAFAEGVEPFVQQEIIFGALIEVWENSDQWGQPVRASLGKDGFIVDSAMHLAKRWEPGLTKPIRRTWNAARGEFSSNLTKPPPHAEAGEFVGFRVRLSNPRKEYDWRLGAMKDELLAADDRLIRAIRDPNKVDDSKLLEIYDDYEKRRERAILNGSIATMDTRYRGTNEQLIEAALGGMGISKEEQKLIQYGGYKANEFGPAFQQKLMDDLRRQALSEEDAQTLVGQVQERVALLKRTAMERRSQEGARQFQWER